MYQQLKESKSKGMIVTPDRYYNMNEHDKELYISQIKEIIRYNNNTLFKRMENIVKRHVKAYQQDFYIHDIYSLFNNDSEFIWMVRSSGTDLIIKNGHCISEGGNWTGKLWFNATKEKAEHYYYYNPKTNKLIKITLDKATEIVEKFNEYNLQKTG